MCSWNLRNRLLDLLQKNVHSPEGNQTRNFVNLVVFVANKNRFQFTDSQKIFGPFPVLLRVFEHPIWLSSPAWVFSNFFIFLLLPPYHRSPIVIRGSHSDKPLPRSPIPDLWPEGLVHKTAKIDKLFATCPSNLHVVTRLILPLSRCSSCYFRWVSHLIQKRVITLFGGKSWPPH